MSTDGIKLAAKLDVLIDVNKRMLAALEKNTQNKKSTENSTVEGNENNTRNGDFDAKKLTGFSTSIKELVDVASAAEKIKPGSSKGLVSFYSDIIQNIIEPINKYGDSNLDNFSNFITTISMNTSRLMKELAITSILGPPAIIGSFMFSIVVSNIVNVLSRLPAMSNDLIDGLGVIMRMASDIGKFMLVMALTSLASPAIMSGLLTFNLVVASLTITLWAVDKVIGKNKNIDAGPLGSLMKMGQSIAIFTLAIVGIGMVSPFIMAGLQTFATLMLGISIVLFASQKLVDSNSNLGIGGKSPLGSLSSISMGMAVFVLTIIALNFVQPLLMKGFLVFTAVILGISAVLRIASVIAGDGNKDSPLNSLHKIALGVAAFSLVFILIGSFFSEQYAKGAMIVLLSLAALGVVMPMLGNDKVTAGSKNLLLLSVSLGIFVASLTLYAISPASSLTFSQIGILASVIIGLGIAAAVLGSMDKIAKAGAGTLIILGASLSVFAYGLGTYASSIKQLDSDGRGWERIGMLGAIITGLGLAAAVIGAPGINIAVGIGAGLMIVIGSSLSYFSKGILTFSQAVKNGFTNKDASLLGETITAVGIAISKIGLMSLTIALGLPLFRSIGVGITNMSMGINYFKKTNYTKKDGEMMVDAVDKIVTAFSEPFKKLNILQYLRISAGVSLISDMSKALSSLAKGVGDMANGNVVEYGVKDNKIVPIGTRKLSVDDFRKANLFITRLLGMDEKGAASGMNNPMISALSEFGKASRSGSMWPFGGGYISTGIEMLTKLSKAFGTIGENVLKLSEARFYPLTLGKDKDGMPTLVPGNPVEITESHFIKAGEFINRLIGNTESGNVNPIVKSLYEFGKKARDGAGLFTGGYISEGINMLSKLSKGMGTIGDNVLKLALGEFHPMELINAGTADAKLVPGQPIKITDAHFIAAGGFINRLIGNVETEEGARANPLVTALFDFGKKVKRGGGLWGKGYIQSGIEMLGKLSEAIGGIGENILKLAKGEFVVNEIVDGKLVPSKIVNLDPGTINLAKNNLDAIIAFLPQTMYNIGETFSSKKDMIVAGAEGLSTNTKKYKEIAENIFGTFSDTEKIKKSLENYDFFINSMFTTSDYAKMNDNLSVTLLDKYDRFAKTTESLTKIVTPFEKFVKAFGDMSKHMGVFATNFKVMDAKGISAFKDWTDSMVKISNVDVSKSENIVSFINDSVSAAFGAGKSSAVGNKNPQEYTEADKRSQIESMSKQEGGVMNKQTQQNVSIDTDAIIAAIQQGFASITVDNMTVLNMRQNI